MTVEQIAEAIARQEGFYVLNTIPARSNNPGDMRLGDIGFGTLGEGITVFNDLQHGWDALYREISLILTGKSHAYTLDMPMSAVGMKWSGGDPNWSRNVCEILGIGEDTTLAQLAARTQDAAWPNS